MNKKTLILVLLSVVSLVFLSGIVIVTVSHARDTSPQVMSDDITVKPTPSIIDRDNDYTYNPPVTEDDNSKPVDTELPLEEPFVPATEIDLDPSSITVFINKEYTLPKNYKPEELVTPDIYFDLTYYDERTLMRPEAAKAIERLFLAAQNEGYVLSGVSGYRSYARQKKIFTTNILTKGKTHTLKYSAVPGTSEHQTGLAMDVSCEALGYDLSTRLADMPEGIWLAENAYRYGFIIRYPKGKSDITGYAYEPWHIRYVGPGLAKYLYENDLTLEEYYNYVPSEDFDFELMYADLINITPSPTTLPLDGEGIIVGENGEIIEGELGEEATPSPTPTISPTGTTTPTPTPPPAPTLKPTHKPTLTPTITPTLKPSITPSITPSTTPEDENGEDDNTAGGDQDPSVGDDNGEGSGEEGFDPNVSPLPTPPFSTGTEKTGLILQ